MNEYKTFLKIEKILDSFSRKHSNKEQEFFKKLHQNKELAARSIGVPVKEVEIWTNYSF